MTIKKNKYNIEKLEDWSLEKLLIYIRAINKAKKFIKKNKGGKIK